MTKRKTAVPAVMAGGRLGCLFLFDMRDARLPGRRRLFSCTASKTNHESSSKVTYVSCSCQRAWPKAVATAAARARTAQWTSSSAHEQENDPAPDPKKQFQAGAPSEIG